MLFLRSLALTFSMFSRIPMPKTKWDEKNMSYLLCGLPLIGAAIGIALFLFGRMSMLLGFSALLTAAGYTLIPVLISGGIHLDGFCDTVDALSSRAEPAKKREILKDPRAGAFCVIGACSYFILYVALCAELFGDPNARSAENGLLLPAVFLGLHWISRAATGLASLLYPGNGEQGLLHAFTGAAQKKRSAVLLLLALIGALVLVFLIAPITAAAMLISLVLCLRYLYVTAVHQFCGMSGDLAGFFLQIAELSMLGGIVISQKVMLL